MAVLLEQGLLGVALDVEVADKLGPVDVARADVDDLLELLADGGLVGAVHKLGLLGGSVEVHLGQGGGLSLCRRLGLDGHCFDVASRSMRMVCPGCG